MGPRDVVLELIGDVPGDTLEEKLSVDYLQAGLIDSLGVIDLIGDLEDRLDIAFDGDDFEDPRFTTVGGLVELATEKFRARTA